MTLGNSRRRWLGVLCCGVVLAAAAMGGVARAQEFPSRPIKFIVPFPPGSGTDTEARHFAIKLSEITGQSVVVENRPGGNGFIAVRAVLSAPADGYTVFIGSNSTLAVNAALFKALPYDPIKDFTPLTMMMRSPALLVVPGNSPYKTLAELVADAKAHPGKIDYGAGSAGYQLMAELFNVMADVKTNHIPFKGASEATAAVTSGTVAMSFVEVTSARELVKSGKVRALAVTSDKRVPSLPDVPTSAEAGLPGFTAYTWVAGMVSAKTPRDVADKLAQLMTRIENMPETRAFNDRLGIETLQGGPAELHEFQSKEIELWKRIAKQAKIELL